MNLSDRDRQSIWHPFTQHHVAKNSIAIVNGKGVYLTDEPGNRYIDAISSWWTNLFGHAHPFISQQIKNQLDSLEHVIFSGFTHQPAIDLAETLIRMLGDGQSKVFFSDNGSTSVEVALKMAIQYWSNLGVERNTIIAFKNAYHGDTFGAMSVGARGVFNQPFEPFLFDVSFVDLPDEANFSQVMNDFEDVLRKKKVAAFIFEPLVQGSAGMLMYEAGYLDKMIAAAREREVICIADEVMTGFGRTGKVFASDYLSHQPDIYCLSKGITGGFMPLGVTTCTQKIYDAFLSDDKLKTFFHGHSYTGNPLACAAANASMEVLVHSLPAIQALEAWQREYSQKLKNHPKVEHLRQTGTIVAFEVKSGAAAGYFNNLRDFLYDNFIQRGVLLRPLGNTVYVMPPYVITKEELENVYVVIDEVLDLLNNQRLL
ncbi:MAG: adenosylmethionine--8-amino-7-oxononanoate transaminase [Chitinophagales bacterium]